MTSEKGDRDLRDGESEREGAAPAPADGGEISTPPPIPTKQKLGCAFLLVTLLVLLLLSVLVTR